MFNTTIFGFYSLIGLGLGLWVVLKTLYTTLDYPPKSKWAGYLIILIGTLMLGYVWLITDDLYNSKAKILSEYWLIPGSMYLVMGVGYVLLGLYLKITQWANHIRSPNINIIVHGEDALVHYPKDGNYMYIYFGKDLGKPKKLLKSQFNF